MSGEWIEHDGSGMPVPGETMVELRFRDGDTRIGTARFWSGGAPEDDHWAFFPADPDFDIVAYRILSNPPASPPPSDA